MSEPTIALPSGGEVSLAAVAFLDDLQNAGFCVYVGRDRKVYVCVPAVLPDEADAQMRVFADDIREWLTAVRGDNTWTLDEASITAHLQEALRRALEEAE